ncbi:hypothetical protein OIU84_013217, partial [Salix udensis]
MTSSTTQGLSKAQLFI